MIGENLIFESQSMKTMLSTILGWETEIDKTNAWCILILTSSLPYLDGLNANK